VRSTGTKAPRGASSQAPRRARLGLRAIATATGLVIATATMVGLGTAPAYASDAGSMVSKTNSSRGSHGMRGYSVKSDLNSVALRQAKRMASSGKLFHNPNLNSDVHGWRYVGENVGYGPSADRIYTALMNSAPHRANILDGDYTQIGVGAVRDGKGRLWVAQVFREPMNSTSSAPAKKAVKKSSASSPARSVRVATRTSNATAPQKAKPAPKASPKPVVQAPAPAPEPTIAQRLASLEKWKAGQAAGDPVSDAIDFAQAMATLSA